MLSWRARKRRFRRNALLILFLAGGVTWWCWPAGSPSVGEQPEDHSWLALSGQTAPALRRMNPPETLTAETDTPSQVKSKSAESGPASGVESEPAEEERKDEEPLPVSPNAPVALPGSPTSRPADRAAMTPVALAEASGLLHDGLKALDRGDLLIARTALNRVIAAGLPSAELKTARRALDKVAERTIFARGHVPNDPLTEYHTVVSGDTLGLLAKRYKVTSALLQEINGLHNPNHIRAGQRLKVIKGPFHATVSKSDHLMHLYLRDTYVRTYRVALGVAGNTPKGRWKVKNKLTNPDWTDPRTGKRWQADDPKNPIGEFWIGLEGIAGNAVGQFGYGIHGTIEPETIGRDVSMGCVRLSAGDIDAVYKMFVHGHSIVTIVE